MLESLQESFAAMVILGLFTGAAFGFTLQRGRFCMNTAFRDILLTKDFTTFQAYILALLISIVGVNLLVDFGLIESEIKPFNWLANAIGGYLFGIGIVFAGGCGSGTWYRVGEGLVGSMVAVLGFAISAMAASIGKLDFIRKYLRQEDFTIQINDQAPTLHGLVGANKWIVIAVITAALGIWLFRAQRPAHQKGWTWPVTGAVIGLLIVFGWWSSSLVGKAEGITLASTTVSLLSYPTVGIPKPNWGMFMLIGIPLGAFVSARLLGEAKLRGPSEPSRYLKQFGGGLLMGFAAMQSGGCNINQGLTNLSMLSLGSLEVILFIILGNWTMVWFLFLRD
ncbi:MAG: YeeE/YedE family protein [Nitrospirota bacterium]